MASNQLYVQSEKVRAKFPEWYQMKWSVATDLINRQGGEERIGERDFRNPFDKTEGGRFGKYDPNAGDMGRGAGPTGDVMTGSYFSVRLNFELSDLAIKATDRSPNDISNGYKVFKRTIKKAFPTMMKYLDKTFHSDGTAVLATATAHTTSSSKSLYTLDTNFGAMRLVRGQYVTVYDTTLATINSASTLYVDYVDYVNRQVRLSGTVPGAAATDKICFEGVSGSSPAGFRGLYYWNDYTTSGTTAGINRANEPEIWANSVNASSTGLTHEMGMALLHRMLMRRGEIGDRVVGFAAPAQQAQIWSNLLSIQNYDASNSQQYIDRLPVGLRKKSFVWCTVPHFVDIHQDQKRLDWIDPSTFVKCVLSPPDYFETPGDSQRFYRPYGGSGAPAAAVWFGLTCDMDYANDNPGVNGVVYGLALPSTSFYG